VADLPTAVTRDGSLDAIAFGVAADLVYNVFSATNSSPQTTELFAADRADTLWKYVKLGGAQSVILIGIMAYRGRSAWAIAGGALAGGMMWAMYAHALKSGNAGGVTPGKEHGLTWPKYGLGD
jgi:hypothetical protein